MKEKIFELLVEMMLAAGGDGDSLLMCDDWKTAADEFEKWSNEKHTEFFTRADNDDSVVFQGNGIGTQEGIIITSYDSKMYDRFAEVTIKTLLF